MDDRERVTRALGIVLALGLAGLGLSACALPEHMEVRAGIDPRNQDDDVRFRTTYYFRVFDACPVPTNRRLAMSDDTDTFIKMNDGPYRIALDSLYRFRMTGKADALFSKVHFEAGTLHKSEIDPFGANVVFDEKSGRFHFESREQTEADAQRNGMFQQLARLLREYERLKDSLDDGKGQPETGSEGLIKEFREAIKDQIGRIGFYHAPVTAGRIAKALEAASKLKKMAAELNADLEANKKAQTAAGEAESIHEDAEEAVTTADADKIEAKRTEADKAKKEAERLRALANVAVAKIQKTAGEKAAAAQTAVAELVTKIAGANTETASAVQKAAESSSESEADKVAGAASAAVTDINEAADALNDFAVVSSATDTLQCSNARRGFQILGPEGWRTFDQDERLVLAMNSSGKPLLSALKEIAGRVLNEQPTRGATLLPLVQERLKIVNAERAIDDLKSGEQPKAAEDALAAIIKAFDPEAANGDGL